MMGQPNIPEEAQEKMETLQQLQETHEETLQSLEDHEQRYQSVVEAQSFLNQTEEDTNVYRQIDDLLFEIDYEEAEEHIQEKNGTIRR
jgi:prefoldin beta subunit